MTIPNGRPFLRRGPSGPLAVDAAREILQIGYDQPDDTMIVPPSASGAFFPRKSTGAPLKVVLADVTPGDFLEIDFRANLEAAVDESYAAEFTFKAIAVVTFDGSAPSVPSATTFFVVDSWTTSLFQDVVGSTTIGDRQSMSSLALVKIPDGATTATVQVLYISDGDVNVGGAVAFQQNGLGATLKVTEFAGDQSSNAATGVGAGIISQTGPGNLVSTL
jgi:hypothetical protein